MTAPLAGRPGLARRALTPAAMTAAVAAGAGLGLAWPGADPGRPGSGLVASGAGTAAAALVVLLAGTNGFAKAYSP